MGDEIMRNYGDYLREQTKLCKVYNPDWSYKQMAEVIGMTAHAFYNWLNGYYNLSRRKQQLLESLLNDLMS